MEDGHLNRQMQQLLAGGAVGLSPKSKFSILPISIPHGGLLGSAKRIFRESRANNLFSADPWSYFSKASDPGACLEAAVKGSQIHLAGPYL